jgi:pimeloyl-ACP methyl ester carboxylesterase
MNQTAAVTPETGFADVPGGRLYYETAGSGDAVVLIHGRAGDRRHWDLQFPGLAAAYRAVRYDARGFGKSSLPVEGEPYADHADLAALLDHLGVESAHIVGWSMGSGIVGDFVLAYPDRARSAAFVGPWLNGHASPAAQEVMDGFGQVGVAISARGADVALEAWMNVPFFRDTLRDPEAARRFRTIAADNSFWEFSHQSPQQFLVPNAVERAHEIGIPTLIVTAEHDIPACKEVATILAESVPNSRKVTMVETGHLMFMEKPTEFNDLLVNFIRGVGGGEGESISWARS